VPGTSRQAAAVFGTTACWTLKIAAAIAAPMQGPTM